MSLLKNLLLVNGFEDEKGGGAMAIESWAENCTIENCTFKNNNASHGGAMIAGAFDYIKGCKFDNNTASEEGGAITIIDRPWNYKYQLSNNNFIGNSAKEGLAIYTCHNIFLLNNNFEKLTDENPITAYRATVTYLIYPIVILQEKVICGGITSCKIINFTIN